MDRIFRTAEEKDIDDIIRLIKQRIQWMDEQHLHQWNEVDYLEAYPRTYFAKNISSFIVVQEAEKVVAAIAIYRSDELWEEDIPAFYLHHLVSDLTVRGAGSDLMIFVEQYAKQQGVHVLRMDSDIHNSKLGQYYEHRGYLPKGEYVAGPYVGIRREKIL